MIITDLNNQTELVVDVNNISIRRKLGGEQTLQFTALNTDKNSAGYAIIQDESIVEGNNERFVIKNIIEGPYSKSVIAINSFFEAIHDYVLQTFPDGLYTIEEGLGLAFSTSDWSYVIQDNYPQRAKLTEFGNDNAVSMLNKVVNAFNSEYEIDSINKRVIIKRRVGVDTDYQIRYKTNIQNINRKIDSDGVKTQVQLFYNLDEFGNYNSSIVYQSPNFNKYPKAKVRAPIYSDVITTEEQAISTARLILKDTPDITVSVDFLSLQQLGYNGDEIQLGNGVYLIDERLNIDSLARITEIEEFYKIERGQLVKDNSRPDIVTISNVRKNIINNIIEQQQQQASTERTAVKQRTLYNGCNISPEEGFTTTAMNGVKTYQNSTEGLRITVDDVNQFFVDPINRQLTLDGRLLITNNQSPLFDGFLDENGGNLKIYDNIGNINVSIGSNSSLLDTTGGDITIYEDSGTPRARMFVRRGDNSGELNLYNGNSPLPKINLSSNVSNGNMILLYDDNDNIQTTLGVARGEIGGSRIITQLLLDAFNAEIRNYINDEIDYVLSQIPDGE